MNAVISVANDERGNERRMQRICRKLWSYLAPFLRYGHLLGETCVFIIPVSYLAPSLPIFPFGYHDEVKRQETRVMGLLCGEGCMILTSTVFD